MSDVETPHENMMVTINTLKIAKNLSHNLNCFKPRKHLKLGD